jgi:hypothetical protein
MPSLFVGHPCQTSATAVLLLMGLTASGCSKVDSAQARGRDDAAKPVKIEAVSEQTQIRSIEVSALWPPWTKSRSRRGRWVVNRILHDSAIESAPATPGRARSREANTT